MCCKWRDNSDLWQCLIYIQISKKNCRWIGRVRTANQSIRIFANKADQFETNAKILAHHLLFIVYFASLFRVNVLRMMESERKHAGTKNSNYSLSKFIVNIFFLHGMLQKQSPSLRIYSCIYKFKCEIGSCTDHGTSPMNQTTTEPFPLFRFICRSIWFICEK